jgi:hypothetical protein
MSGYITEISHSVKKTLAIYMTTSSREKSTNPVIFQRDPRKWWGEDPFELQARLLGKYLQGELDAYAPLMTK